MGLNEGPFMGNGDFRYRRTVTHLRTTRFLITRPDPGSGLPSVAHHPITALRARVEATTAPHTAGPLDPCTGVLVELAGLDAKEEGLPLGGRVA